MPMERERYPDNWKQIALVVKERAGWTCQKCGAQCRKPGEPLDTHRRTLTVAHLNHRPEDVRPENLCAMCAPCHLRYDAKHHAETRKKRRAIMEPSLIERDRGDVRNGLCGISEEQADHGEGERV